MRYFVLAFVMLSIFSCGKKQERKVPVFEEMVEEDDTCEDSDNNYAQNENVVEIPFVVENGVKLVDVNINDAIGVKMIVDTGCSGALISLSEARYLVEKGTLTEDDVVGEGSSIVADGRIVANMVVRLHKITIGDRLTANDVEAVVSDNINAPLLLGNEVLDRVRTIAIDNESQCILFLLK